jgi:hypothetical protein
MIDAYFTSVPSVKSLAFTDQMNKIKPTEYYIVYDFETVEKPLNNNNKNITIYRKDHDTSSSSLFQPSSSSSNPTQNTTKISHVVLLSAVWAAKIKSGIKTTYFDRRDGDDFVIKCIKSLVKVTEEVSKDNIYDCINYTAKKIPNFVPVLGFNLARFDVNFIIHILHNPPHGYIEFIIGNLNYFKMVTVRTFDGLCLKFLDGMNYVPRQTLHYFAKMFGNVKDLQKGVFAYDGFNSTNYMEVLKKTEPFAEVDFHSSLRDLDINDKDYQTYLQGWKSKEFPNRLEYLKYYNINDIEIMISSIDSLIKMFFEWKVDMLANITLASIYQSIKFKLLYDDWVRPHPLKRSNQPVITSFHVYDSNNNYKKKYSKIVKEKNNNNNDDVANEYEIDLDDYYRQ